MGWYCWSLFGGGIKMVSDVGLIAVSFISLAGMVLIFMLNTRTWFKKETFKSTQASNRKEMNIRFKAMERDLKIKETPPLAPPEQSIPDLLKGLDLETIKKLGGMLQKDDVEYEDEEPIREEKPDLAETVLNMAQKNPELAKSIIDKFLPELKPKEGPQER